MNKKFIGTVIVSLFAIAGLTSTGQIAFASHTSGAMLGQTGALVGYGGLLFGIVDVDTNGHITDVRLATDFLSPEGEVFEVWMVDGNAGASGYPLSLGQIFQDGTLDFSQHMVNSHTYTDIIVTLEPINDLDPKPAWSRTVAANLLAPPFGK